MRKIIIFSLLLVTCTGALAKNYPFDIKRSYEVILVRIGKPGTKFCKAWGVSTSVDKAITQAMQDAVAAALFTGISWQQTEGTQINGDFTNLAPLCADGLNAYTQNESFFKEFFKKGKFLNYVENSNTHYPTGENNVSTSKGRKVGVYIVIKYDELRLFMQQNGIKTSQDINQFG